MIGANVSDSRTSPGPASESPMNDRLQNSMTAVSSPFKLSIRGLYKAYGDAVALERVTMDVLTGEFVTLLGPSGSGKSTLLQLICGLVPPSGGRLFIDGADRTQASAAERDIGVVFQNYALFPHLTVGENVAFPLRIRGLERSVILRRMEAALGMVGLTGYTERMPSELSGGQQQRVALARCLVYQPSLILMDESFSALDRNRRLVLQDEVRRIHRETGTTFIFVTHDQEEAMTMSDRICLMNRGRVEQFDTPRALYDTPRTVFAADFIGTSTILQGVVRPGGRLATPVGDLPLPDGSSVSAGTKGALVLRPEHLRLHTDDETGLRGVVEDVTFGGAEQRVRFRLGNDQKIVVQVPATLALSAGQAATVRWNAGDGHFIPDQEA